MNKPFSVFLLAATTSMAFAIGDAAEVGSPSLRATATESEMARALIEGMSQARPLPDEHRHLLLRLLVADGDEKAVVLDGSVTTDSEATSGNSTDLPTLLASDTDGSASTSASKFEFVCFWRPAPIGQRCYNL